MTSPKKISARKVAILYMLEAPETPNGSPTPVQGITKLQKLLFLVDSEYGKQLDTNIWNVDFDYVAEKFGPADLGLYKDLDFLEVVGHISSGSRIMGEPSTVLEESGGVLALPEQQVEEALSFDYLMRGQAEESEAQPSDIEKTYAITGKGVHFLSQFEARSGQEQRVQITNLRRSCGEIKRKYNMWPLARLLGFVYRKYPTMTTESTIKDRVLGRY